MDNLKVQVAAKKETLEKKRAERLRDRANYPTAEGGSEEGRERDRSRERDRDRDR